MNRNLLLKLSAYTLGGGALFSYPIIRSNTEIQFQKTEENVAIMNLCKSHLKQYLPSYHLFPHGAF